MSSQSPDHSSQERDDYSTQTLMPQLYDELRKLAAHKIANEKAGHTLTGTALLHEAYLRVDKGRKRWPNQKLFFSAAAEAMRRILIEQARSKHRVKRGAGYQRTDLETTDIEAPPTDDHILAVNEALEAMEENDPEGAELVKLRFFAGLTLEETAESLGVSVRTVTRQWAYTRAWIANYLRTERK